MGSPFESGKTLIFKTKASGKKRYLNSAPNETERSKSVYLIGSIDYNKHPGTHWEVTTIKSPSGGTAYRLTTLSTYPSDKIFLDSKSAADKNKSVFLKNISAEGGSYWTPILLQDGSYLLKSCTISGPKCYMDASPNSDKEDSIWLAENFDHIGTHWMVGVDTYTVQEIEGMIKSKYHDIVMMTAHMSIEFTSLDFDIIYNIWKDLNLHNYEEKGKTFSQDFAIIMKGEVTKYSYNLKIKNSKACLCGILWDKTKTKALNFTIDPFGNFILFDPQQGKEYTSTFDAAFYML